METNTPIDSEKTIPIVGRQDLETLGLIQLNILEHQKVPVSRIADQMNGVIDGLKSILDKLPTVLGNFHLTEMTVALEISAKGSVSVLGTGGEAAGKGGVTLKLTRKP